MPSFPVSKSNLSAAHLAPLLAQKYALSPSTKCQFIRSGLNDTYLLSDGGKKWIFRVYSWNWRSKTEISEEIRFLNTLVAKDLPVSHPIQDIESQYIQVFQAPEGERYGLLFSYAEGEKMPGLSATLHYEVGVLMAKIHRVSEHLTLDRVQYSEKEMLQEAMERLKIFIPEDGEAMTFMAASQQYLSATFSKMDHSVIRKGVVHLDIWPDNFNISAQNKITLFDFDFCGNGALALDVAYYLLQLRRAEKDEDVYQNKVGQFIKGYESVTPLSSEEKRLLPHWGLCLYFFYLGTQCQRFETWSNTFLSAPYLRQYIKLLIQPFSEYHQLDN